MPGEVRTEERAMTATRTTIGETGSADRAESDGWRPFPWWLWLVPFLLAVGIPALYRQRFNTIHPLRLESYLIGTLLVLVVGLIIVAAISSGFPLYPRQRRAGPRARPPGRRPAGGAGGREELRQKVNSRFGTYCSNSIFSNLSIIDS